ncbi:CLUMA_CG014177, isoform A [Clunio marinus]|uniref:CLUMA_CG014177, isoform A n=1 Tax=Clunio marinus TaxID=568069 RepID=A0A1J1ILV4_9DIPT|nr:CLUMA_CG014177, isoform A [Clunio marinus]
MTRINFTAIFLCLHIIECHRIHLSDSIMDIINTQHVEKILADRRQNNNLDDDVTETETDVYPTSDTLIDFDYNTNQPQRNRLPLPIHGDIVMKYNDSIIPSPSSTYASRFPNADGNLLADLQTYRGDKILKSSKSALFIAKKELLKQDWCKTEPFEQKIREDGCYSKKVINNFCYGQCNSFYVPKTPRRRRRNHRNQRDHRVRQSHNNVDSFRSCAYCKPKEYTFVNVILKCPSLTPNYRRKRIQIVKECRCIAQNVN